MSVPCPETHLKDKVYPKRVSLTRIRKQPLGLSVSSCSACLREGNKQKMNALVPATLDSEGGSPALCSLPACSMPQTLPPADDAVKPLLNGAGVVLHCARLRLLEPPH